MLAACGQDEASSTTQAITTLNNLSIESNKLLSEYTTDMCTEIAGQGCYFTGGQRVKYSDGTVYISGVWQTIYVSGGDTDMDQNTVSVIIPPNMTTGDVALSDFVARGTGFKRVFLHYSRSTDSVSLVFDTNGSNVVDSGDEAIAVLTQTNW